MSTKEFWARIGPDRTLTVPPELAAELPRDRPLKVILLVPEADDEQVWTVLSAERFLDGYAEGDAIYDDLPDG